MSPLLPFSGSRGAPSIVDATCVSSIHTDDAVGAGRAADRGRVRRRVLDRDLTAPRTAGSAARRRAAGSSARSRSSSPTSITARAVAHERDPARALRWPRSSCARARALREVVVLEVAGELLVGRDALERLPGPRAVASLVHVDRDRLLRREPRVRLAVLVVGDEAEQDDRHRHHRDDDDEDEEEGEAAAKAHPCGLHRPIRRVRSRLQGALRHTARAGPREPEVVAQGRALVVAAEDPAALELGDDVVGERDAGCPGASAA